MGRLLLAGLIVAFASVAQAQSSANLAEYRERVNAGVVGLVAAKRTGTLTEFADDMAGVLNEVDGLRVLPILGRGSLGNLEDLMFLRGVDVALTQGDVLKFYREINPNLNSEAIGYVAALGMKEAHLLARKEIQSIDDLQGKKVNFGWPDSGSMISSSIIFDDLGLEVEAQTDLHKIAMLKLKKGEIDAMFWMGGSPIGSMQEVTEEDGLHLLPIPVERISVESYVPVSLESSDYPTLIEPGQSVQTAGVQIVMAAYRWPEGHPRKAAVELFTQSLFENADQLAQEPYHPKWKSMNLKEDVPGWRRVLELDSLELSSR